MVPDVKLVAFKLVNPLPLPYIVPFVLMSSATPRPPCIRNAAVVYALAFVVSVNVLTPDIL